VNWNGGTFAAGQTFQTGGAATITNSQGVPQMNGTWNNSGAINASNNVFATGATVGGSGVINNLAGASYLFNGAGLDGTGTFNNFGTVNLQTPGGTGFSPVMHWSFNNKPGGVVTGSNTTLQVFSVGTQDGTFNMTSAALQFETGSNNTFTASSVVTGSVNFYVFGGAATINGTFTPSGQIWVGTGAATLTFNSAFGGTGNLRIDAGGVVNLNQPTTLANFSLNNGGTLGGSGALTFSGTTAASINGGTLAGTAAAAVQNVGTLAIAGTNQSTLAHNLTNAGGGLINWSNAGPLALTAGTTLTNAAGAVFTAAGHVDLLGSVTATDGVFDNYGTFTKLTDTGTINIRSTFNNRAGATVNVQTGTLNLANPGVMAGGFNVSSGATLAFSGTETLSSAINVAGGGTLAVNGGTATITGTLGVPNFSLNGGTLTGTGTLAVGNTLTMTGGTLGLNLATNAASANLFNGGTLTVGSGFALTVPTGNTFQTVAGTIAGPGAVVNQDTLLKTGSGTVTITAPFTNAATALVQVQGGILSVNGGTLAGTYNVLAGATLNFAGTESVPGPVTFSGPGTVAVTGGTTTVAGSVAYSNFSLAGGTLAGTGPLTGSSLSITAGTLARDFAVNGTASNTFGGGTLTVGSGFTMTVPAGMTLQASVGTVAGPGAVVNQGTITKTGTGSVTITAPFTNAAGAQVLIQAGTLSFGGGSLDGSYAVSAGATLNLAAGAAVLSTASITGGGQLTTGAAVTMAAGAANTYSGGTTVNSGGNLLVTGAGPALGTGAVTLAGGGLLRLSDAANVGAGAKVAVPTGAILGLEAGFDPAPIVAATAAGVLAVDTANFSTPLTMNSIGGGSMFLGSTGTGIYTAATLGAGAVNAFRLGGGGGNLTLGGTNVLTGSSVAIIGGAGLTGTVRITAANNYTGSTTLAGGTLAVGNAAALGTGPLIFNGGTVQADGGPVNLANAVTLGGNPTIGGTDLLTLSGPMTLTGNRTVAVNGPGGLSITGNIGFDIIGRSLTKAGPGPLTLSGTNTYSGGTTVNAGTLQTTGGNQALGLGNVTVNTGAALRQASFANLGGGSSVRVNSGGVLGLDGNFPPSLDPASTGLVAIDTITYSQPLNQTTMGNGQLFLGAMGTGQYNAATLGAGTGSAYRLGGAGGTLTIPNANVLTGFNSLLVGSTQANGAGTVVLSAAQDFQGNTTINAGSKLVLDTALTGPGTIFILPGATLAGDGVTGGYVNLGGTVSPGHSPGTLTFTNGVGFGAGSHYQWELSALSTGGPGTVYDQVLVTGGTVTVDPAAVFDLSFTGTSTNPAGGDPFWQAVHSWPVVALSGSAVVSGPLAFHVDNTGWSAAGTFVTGPDAGGSAVDLVWLPASVPEPGTLALSGLAAIGWLAVRRRRVATVGT
jgi:fibronectin-binding autotransporter adhesin